MGYDTNYVDDDCFVNHTGDKEVEFETEGLPEGWVKIKLEGISLKLKAGGTPSTKNPDFYKNGKIPFVKIEDMSNSVKYLDSTKINITKKGLDSSSSWEVPKNSILYSMYASFGIPIINQIPVTTSQAIIALIPMLNLVVLDYVYYFLQNARKELIPKGTTQKNLNAEMVKNIKFLLPPLPEQHRIVSKLESILGRIDACIDRLEKLVQQTKSASGSLSQLKSSILKQAFEGKLVPQDPNDEPAEVLLKRLHVDSDKLEFETEGLPEGWVGTHVENVCKTTSGGTPSRKNPDYYDGDIPWLKSGELNDEIIFESDEKISQDALDKSNAKIFPKGTMLMAMYGATIGKLGILGIPSSTNQAICAFLNMGDDLNKSFLFYFLLYSRKKLTEKGFGGAQNNISQTIIKNLSIPIPPLNEQHRIVSKIESIFGKIDAKMELIKVRVLFTCLVHIIR